MQDQKSVKAAAEPQDHKDRFDKEKYHKDDSDKVKKEKQKQQNVYNCIQKLIDILSLSGIIIKRKAKALEATA